jgi:hypothetical protein
VTDAFVFQDDRKSEAAADHLVVAAETVFRQRQARCAIISADLLGEPAWDILLCAYIASRKGAGCMLNDVAKRIGLSIWTARRWVTLLEAKQMIVSNGEAFALTFEAEKAMSRLLELQLQELRDQSEGRR